MTQKYDVTRHHPSLFTYLILICIRRYALYEYNSAKYKAADGTIDDDETGYDGKSSGCQLFTMTPYLHVFFLKNSSDVLNWEI